MSSVSIDASELRKFSVDLTQASAKVVLGARGVINTGALRIKEQMQSEMRGSRHFKGAASDISYDLDAAGLSAEIGPRSGPGNPGALANVAYFGTSRGGGSVPDPSGALEAEAVEVERRLAELVGDAL